MKQGVEEGKEGGGWPIAIINARTFNVFIGN